MVSDKFVSTAVLLANAQHSCVPFWFFTGIFILVLKSNSVLASKILSLSNEDFNINFDFSNGADSTNCISCLANYIGVNTINNIAIIKRHIFVYLFFLIISPFMLNYIILQ